MQVAAPWDFSACDCGQSVSSGTDVITGGVWPCQAVTAPKLAPTACFLVRKSAQLPPLQWGFLCAGGCRVSPLSGGVDTGNADIPTGNPLCPADFPQLQEGAATSTALRLSPGLHLIPGGWSLIAIMGHQEQGTGICHAHKPGM